jgi:two-component system, NtrC family, response regulator GlrR
MSSSSAGLTLTISRRAGQDCVEVPNALARLQCGDQVSEAAVGLAPVLVGSGQECGLVAQDSSVSRVHLELRLGANGVLVRDLGSKNGTFIGGARIIEAYALPNVPITLGTSQLTLFLGGPPSLLPLSGAARFGEALGSSVVMRALFARLERAAAADEPVLLLGESGTGKEVLARAVHEHSPRKEGPFVVFDCGAVAPTLIEAQLFGYEKGAFTGATERRDGLFHAADQGTFFLDEIGELPLELQPRLLRVLETGQVRRVGGTAFEKVSARILAATHRDLRSAMASGSFRSDLYYRLSVFEATIPPLRERKDDIPLLVEQFLAGQTPPRTLKDLPPHALDLLAAHDWPGNVRELRNTLTRLVLFPNLPPDLFRRPKAENETAGIEDLLSLSLRDARDLLVADFERKYVTAKLREHGGNVTATADAMGLSRQFLHRLIARYGLGSGHGRS